eukprot:252600_1
MLSLSVIIIISKHHQNTTQPLLSIHQTQTIQSPQMSKSEAVKVAARIRRFLPWEDEKQVYELQNETEIGLPAKQSGSQFIGKQKVETMNFMNFNAVFDRECNNLDVFNGTAKTLCDNMIETGFNSLLFAYGQTGSGKTFTLLGNPGKNDGVKGVLTHAIDYLLHHPSGKVSKCCISVNEVYSTSTNKMDMFDLFDASNANEGDWSKKQGEREITDDEIIKKEITRNTDVNALISLAQSAAHYAPTGKNPQSSRGHTAFIIEIGMSDGHRCDFVCLDLAGSEGITAITPAFIKKVGEATAKVRLMEGGAINYGLQQIQAILKEVGSKKGVEKTQGNGIRKLLWPFVQKKNQPLITVLFTLSPSTTNIDTTRDTFRVATTMAGLKIKPVRVTKSKSKDQIIRELKKTIRDQEMKINKLLKEGGDGATMNAPVMKLQRQMTKEFAVEQRTEREKEAIEYNVNDLNGHKSTLMAYQRQLTTMIESQQGDDDELLKAELEDITEEIEHMDCHIVAMQKLEKELESAITNDARRNSKLNQRQSQQLLMHVLADLAEEDEEEEEEDDDDDDEFVRVNKTDLIELSQQLNELSQNMKTKKERAKKRNQDLLFFVEKLQNEQKDILNTLNTKLQNRQ